jgi:quinol monooxygenase YgiN
MVYKIIRYRVGPERAEAFFNACSEVEASLRASPHCLYFGLSRCTEAPDNFVLTIGWDSLNFRLERFQASRKLEPFSDSVQPLTTAIWECGRYETVALEGREASHV